MFLASAIALSSISIAQPQVEAAQVKKPTNVIMLVMDGSSNNAVTLSRWYKGQSLAMDEILSGACVHTLPNQLLLIQLLPLLR